MTIEQLQNRIDLLVMGKEKLLIQIDSLTKQVFKNEGAIDILTEQISAIKELNSKEPTEDE